MDKKIQITLKKKFRINEKIKYAYNNQDSNNLVLELHKYYEDLILLGNFNQQK